MSKFSCMLECDENLQFNDVDRFSKLVAGAHQQFIQFGQQSMCSRAMPVIHSPDCQQGHNHGISANHVSHNIMVRRLSWQQQNILWECVGRV